MKKFLWVLPVLAIGIAIGGLTLPNDVFASTNGQSTTPTTQTWGSAGNAGMMGYGVTPNGGISTNSYPSRGYGMMGQGFGNGTSQSNWNAMTQACGSFMSQFYQNQK